MERARVYTGAAARVTCVPRAGAGLRGAAGLLSTYPRYLNHDTSILFLCSSTRLSARGTPLSPSAKTPATLA